MSIVFVHDIVDPDDPQGRTYKEVNEAKPHRFKVGDLVELETGSRLFVAKQIRDCDGTPLYCLTPLKGDCQQERSGFANHNWLNSYGEDSLKDVGNP